MDPALVVTGGALIFAVLIFASLFRYLEPAKVANDYKPCSGGWHEAELYACSTGLTRVPQQPINTYTNLAYLAAGLYLQFKLDTGPAFVFALTMMYLCIGSTLYHATSTGWAGMLDVTGIYTVYAGMLVYAFAALLGEGHDPLVPAGMFLGAGGAAFLLSKRRHSMVAVIAILLGVTYALLLARMAYARDWTALVEVLISIGLFAVGFASWALDQKRLFPIKAWGHGVWHLFTAAASAVAFHAIHRTILST